MDLISSFVTVAVAVFLGYLVFRAYLMGKTDGLNSELFD